MKLSMRIEQVELTQPFVIARGAIDRVALVVVEVAVDGVTGRGEGEPQAFMGQSPERDLQLLEELRDPLEQGMDRNDLSEYRDLDGLTMLRGDRPHGLRIERGLIHPLERSLWGGARP